MARAREELRRAHAIFPNARTLRGLGMVEFELRSYVQSVQLLEQALAASVKPLDGKLRTDTEALLARAQRRSCSTSSHARQAYGCVWPAGN
jgi:hypothetical protein